MNNLLKEQKNRLSMFDVRVYNDYIGWTYSNRFKFIVEVDACKACYSDSVEAYFYKDRFLQDKDWKRREEKFKQVNKDIVLKIKEDTR